MRISWSLASEVIGTSACLYSRPTFLLLRHYSFRVINTAEDTGMRIAPHNETIHCPRLLLTAAEVGEQLSVSRLTAYSLISEGILPAVRIGRSVRVPARALEQWVQDQTKTRGQ